MGSRKLYRAIYFPYYVKTTDWIKFSSFTEFVSRARKLDKIIIYEDVMRSIWTYNIAPLDYFYFRFDQLTKDERDQYVGTGFMYEYQKVMNPYPARERLMDKIIFLQSYREFIRRRWVSLSNLENENKATDWLLRGDVEKIVLKYSRGQIGKEVHVLNRSEFNDHAALVKYMKRNELDLIEEFIDQHRDLATLSESGLNTVRFFTQLNGQEVVNLGVRLRITVNSAIDNMAAGNLAAPVDVNTGIVSGPAVYSDVTKASVSIHPISEVQIVGFQIPFWKETVSMINKAARLFPENKSIGWDVAISQDGPELVEGNHNWCKLLWQLPVGQGLKHLLLPYLPKNW